MTSVLCSEKENCCACAACMNACSMQSISMLEDEFGFLYPSIDKNKCIGCGLCSKVCAFQNKHNQYTEPKNVFAAIHRDKDTILHSASGGAFMSLAEKVINDGGVVCGCIFDGNLYPIHKCVEDIEGLKRIQGSKYVQSAIGNVYKEIYEYLKTGRKVLFSGTPCQVDGIKAYMGSDCDNLLTVDLICHGVPSAAFFNGYISLLEKKLGGKISEYIFRDKSEGWGLRGKVVYEAGGKRKWKKINISESYYYALFLKGEIYRESCYSCKYACGNRTGDFTIGDYWGISKVHPEVNEQDGVSVLLVNSTKGSEFVKKLHQNTVLIESTYEKAKIKNGQLRHPAHRGPNRERILEEWKSGGAVAVEEFYASTFRGEIVKGKVKSMIPVGIKKRLKRLLFK